MTMNGLQLRGCPSWEQGVSTAAAHAQRDWRSSRPQSPVNRWADVETKSADPAEPPTDVLSDTDARSGSSDRVC
jgi:hypothetical protein